jgi:deferrochelatase/peroxidase EfeB
MDELNDVEIKSLQGNILRGYTLGFARHMILQITDRSAARAFLAASVSGSPEVPQITTEQPVTEKGHKPATAFNLGFTYEGLKALGLAAEDLATFPTEFRLGMTSRAAKLGDFGESAPSNWPSPYDDPGRIHVIATAYASNEDELKRIQEKTSRAFNVLGFHDGRAPPDGEVFFGYRDGLSQPRYACFHKVASSRAHPDRAIEPDDPVGTTLLGKSTRLAGLKFTVPSPTELGTLGTFNAFRVMAQDCTAFEDFLTSTAKKLQEQGVDGQLVGAEHVKHIYNELGDFDRLREVIAAQLCGRWRDGTPMQLGQLRRDDPKARFMNDFDYGAGSICPAGSHIRRNNPRGGEIVQRIANFSRKLTRRGMIYGDAFNPKEPDKKERGLLGNFIGASLGAQFEAIMCDWLNLGLNSPDITGSNDPLLGANTPLTSWFDMYLWEKGDAPVIKTHRIYGLPRFVTTRGGAYTFLPTVTGIKYLSVLTA